MFFFYFKDTATTEIYTYGHTLPLHDALPTSAAARLAPAPGLAAAAAQPPAVRPRAVARSAGAGAAAAAGPVVAQADRAPPAAGRRGGLGPAHRRTRPGLKPAQHRRRRMAIPHLPRTRPLATRPDDLASQPQAAPVQQVAQQLGLTSHQRTAATGPPRPREKED